jgi:tetratricopeptide (TPR) repeat protein
MDPAYLELGQALRSRQLVVFVGAGVSAAAGLPSWKGLVNSLLNHLRARGAADAVVAEIEDLAEHQKLIDAVTATREALGDSEFGAVVERLLDDREHDVPEIATAISELGYGIRAVLTTNIDNLLERAFAGRLPTLSRATGDIGQRERFLLKLHGTLLDRETWVFTRDQYERAMYADPRYQAAFSALFNARTLLFVGYGLADEDFDLVLARSRALTHGQPPRHFAIVSADTIAPYRQRQIEKAGVRVIPYVNEDGRHSAAIGLLRQIGALGASGVSSAVPGVAPPLEPDSNSLLSLCRPLGPVRSDASPVASNVAIHIRVGGPSESSTGQHDLRDRHGLLSGSDLPPTVPVWVGRMSELAAIAGMRGGVLAITGIGGQGKSALAAKFLEELLENKPDMTWAWRDCREEADRFHTQLVSIIEHFSQGNVDGRSLSGAPTRELASYFFRSVSKNGGLVVLDNVDHYVSVTERQFSMDVGAFVETALGAPETLTIVTCRPRISYANSRFREICLDGLSLDETFELFKQLRAHPNFPEASRTISEIHRLTLGHPLWLNLVGTQISRNPAAADVIVSELQRGEVDDRAKTMLRAIWKSVNSKQAIVLCCMAEMTRAETLERIHAFVETRIKSWNQFHRTFHGIAALGLVVERAGPAGQRHYDLHPLVRSFVRSEFSSPRERVRFIDPILRFYDGLMSRFRTIEHARLPQEALNYWLNAAELELGAERPTRAMRLLVDIYDQLLALGLGEEFIRLGRRTCEALDWSSHMSDPKDLFHYFVWKVGQTLAEFGRGAEARALLRRYEAVVPHGTSLYIGLCDIWTYVEWYLGDFAAAAGWGRRGVKLKSDSNMDTHFDCTHHLALALRDGGDVDAAIQIFERQEAMRNSEENAAGAGASAASASYYGNIGRCLQHKGDLSNALANFVRSAQLLEGGVSATDLINRGYAALWIAEVLDSMERWSEAFCFYQWSAATWKKRAPWRAHEPAGKAQAVFHRAVPLDRRAAAEETVGDYCREWLAQYKSDGR